MKVLGVIESYNASSWFLKFMACQLDNRSFFCDSAASFGSGLLIGLALKKVAPLVFKLAGIEVCS